MVYSLKKVDSEFIGDSGHMSMWISCHEFDEKGLPIIETNARPKVGGVIRVGSFYARTFDRQDWWQTSEIMEILEETETYVKFKTKNSIYEWKII